MTDAAQSFGDQIHRLAHEDPTRPAVILASEDGSEVEHSRAEIDERSTQLARLLADRGLGPDDHLAVQLRNSLEFVIGCFAGWKLGATVIPMRWDLPDWELERVRAVARPRIVLAPDTLGLFAEATRCPTEAFSFVTSAVAQGICSSGATGTPKVILRKMPALWPPGARSTGIQEGFGVVDTAGQRTLVCGPMYHTNGFTALSDLLSGYTAVIMQRFTPPAPSTSSSATGPRAWWPPPRSSSGSPRNPASPGATSPACSGCSRGRPSCLRGSPTSGSSSSNRGG